MKNSILLPALAALAFAGHSEAAWQRLGALKNRPVDSASVAVAGVTLQSSQGISQASAMLEEDPAASAKLGTGASSATINVGRQVSLEILELINDGIEGRVAVSGSTDAKDWQSLGQSVFSAADRTVMVKFSAAQGKYIKLDFDLTKGGTVRSLRAFGSDSDANLGESDVNMVGTGATRVIYVHPEPTRGDELGSKYNRFEFPESDEKFRTVIYDFGRARTVSELGSVHSPRPVRLSAYLFESLPETEDWKGRKAFDPSVFESMTPSAVVEDRQGVGFAKAKLSKASTARYIALRWEPDFNPPAFVIGNVLVRSGGSGQCESLGGGGGGSGAGSGSSSSSSNSGSGNIVAGPGAGVIAASSPFGFGAAGGFGGTGVNNGNGNDDDDDRRRPRRPRRPRVSRR
jgi:hypothetical protein